MFPVISPRIETFSEPEIRHSELVDKLRSRIATQQVSDSSVSKPYGSYTKELA